jgi:hypothetical protein
LPQISANGFPQRFLVVGTAPPNEGAAIDLSVASMAPNLVGGSHARYPASGGVAGEEGKEDVRCELLSGFVDKSLEPGNYKKDLTDDAVEKLELVLALHAEKDVGKSSKGKQLWPVVTFSVLLPLLFSLGQR